MDWALILSVANDQENMGHLEEGLLVEGRELQRQLLEKAAQTKADNTPRRCPRCGPPLTRVTHGHGRTVESRFGAVRLRRSRGWCRRCGEYCFPADVRLGLERSTASPGVQETAAMLVSKMSAPEASAVLQRLTGQKISPATLDREARRQGQKAQKKREQLDGQLDDWPGLQQVSQSAQADLPEQPFVLVIEWDAWNIRERDHWGQTQALQEAVWNLVGDRFKGAKELLNFYHAAEHLWTVANTVYAAGSPKAKKWVEPLIDQLKDGQSAEVIKSLEKVLRKLVDRPEDRKTLEVERNYFLTHQNRLDYRAMAEAGYPIGSGAMESTCRQYQCRLKRTGQFWTTVGDEALITLETMWRNHRWRLLYPHADSWDPQRN